ncbi:phosphotransferase-like protein [Anaeromicropila herbilytica]|uniref:Chemotaxis protein n=1 Tax=Anaeromicropila herbilytica TaxID=2785025 RepID=A0A7R7EKX8_9FIRM|nr:AAA family ATPase [Anaeromicropila herbilytica]BCN30791.1 hypothetical protein bsdtb5_20860 [Anaeromicropila herbilytica]
MSEKGKIIFLNGVTSAGKTSIVDEMQARKDRILYVVANDLFEEVIGEEYLKEDFWKYFSEVILMMYRTARLFSDYGKDIIIDGIIVEQPEIRPHYLKLKEIFNGYPLEIIEVYCPLEVCKKRNIERGDRYETQSEEQYHILAEEIEYCYKVDTSLHTSKECADMIIEYVFGD